tara:strand:- start:56 stop:472 length:417 start_codon:yes stop_codon:yes gene_type:complete
MKKDENNLKKALVIVKRKKELRIADNNLVEFRAARKALSVVEESLKFTISNHAQYKDKEGNTSSGAKGLALQINVKIKRAFDHGRDDMSLDELLLLKVLLVKLERVISEGEASRQTRKKIKASAYRTIQQYGELGAMA